MATTLDNINPNLSPETPPPNRKLKLPRTFSSLRHPSFRLFWYGQTISLCGAWMQTVAQSWLVFQLTNSPFWLSVVGAAGNFPILFFSLFGGVVADRISKRGLLVFTQAAAAILALILGLLVSFKMVRVWQIVALAAILGLVEAFDTPARQAFVVEMVGREDLPNAIALHSMIFHASRVIGPAIAGLLIGIFGVSISFFLNALSFVPVIIVLMKMKLPPHKPPDTSASVWEEVSSGLKFVYGQTEARMLILFVSVFALFAMPYAALMPAFARDILGLGAKGYGGLMSVVGVGALLGALYLATVGDSHNKGRAVAVSALLSSAGLILFAFSHNLWLSAITLFIIGFCFVTGIATSNIILQILTPHELRGRVMSIFVLMFIGMIPIGNLIIGALAHVWGISVAVAIGGGICLLTAIVLFQKQKQFRI